MFGKVSPKWQQNKVSSIEVALGPLLWLNRIVGISVFEVPANSPWIKLTITYGLIRLVAYGTLLWCSLTRIKLKENAEVMSMIYNTMLYVNVTILSVSSILAIINRKQMKEFMKNITLADETLEVFGIDPGYESEFKENKRVVLLWSVIGMFLYNTSLIMIYLHFGDLFHAAIKVTAFEIPQLVNPITELNFVIKISMSREVNDTCSKQLSLQMASTFIILTGFGYCEYVVYNNSKMSSIEKIQSYTSLSIWIVAAFSRLIYVIRKSVNVVAEAEKTSQIAHEIQISGHPVKIIDEIQQLTLQIMQHPLTFTASGLVTLDFGYVRGLLGSVTTYLMILIQNQPNVIKAATTAAQPTLNNTDLMNYSAAK